MHKKSKHEDVGHMGLFRLSHLRPKVWSQVVRIFKDEVCFSQEHKHQKQLEKSCFHQVFKLFLNIKQLKSTRWRNSENARAATKSLCQGKRGWPGIRAISGSAAGAGTFLSQLEVELQGYEVQNCYRSFNCPPVQVPTRQHCRNQLLAPASTTYLPWVLFS